jgi:hypothetical protein
MQVTPTPGASFPVLVKFPVNGPLYPGTSRTEEKLGTWVLHRGLMDRHHPILSICMGLDLWF